MAFLYLLEMTTYLFYVPEAAESTQEVNSRKGVYKSHLLPLFTPSREDMLSYYLLVIGQGKTRVEQSVCVCVCVHAHKIIL